MINPWRKRKPPIAVNPEPAPPANVAPPPPKPPPTYPEVVAEIIDQRENTKPMLARRYIEAALAKPECLDRLRVHAQKFFDAKWAEDAEAAFQIIKADEKNYGRKHADMKDEARAASRPRFTVSYIVGELLANEATEQAMGIVVALLPIPKRPKEEETKAEAETPLAQPGDVTKPMPGTEPLEEAPANVGEPEPAAVASS